MKKRTCYMVALLIVCLLLSWNGPISAKADGESEEYITDSAMQEFMVANDLPVIAIPVKCENYTVYRQTSAEGAEYEFSVSDAATLEEDYGFSSNVIAYSSGSTGIQFYLDIYFADRADIASCDVLRIECPEGIVIRNAEVPMRLLGIGYVGSERTWFLKEDSSVSAATNSRTLEIKLDELAKSDGINRLLLYIKGSGSTVLESNSLQMTVTWEHTLEVQTEEKPSDSVINSNVSIPETDPFPWKLVLLVVVLALDVAVVFVVIRYLRKNVLKNSKYASQQTSCSEEELSAQEAELQQNLKLKKEDIEYLRSIGYFDPDRK